MAAGGFARRDGGGGAGNASVGALLRSRGETNEGLFITDPDADESWHLRGVERTLFEAATAASLVFSNQDQDASLTVDLPTDWVNKPERLNTLALVYQQLARARAAIAADYEIGNLRVTSNKPGPEGNNDLISVTPGSTAHGARNAVAAIQGNRGVIRGGDISVRSPNVAGIAASRVVRITSGSTQQIRITRTAVGEVGNGFRLIFEYDATASAGTPNVTYVTSGSGIDGILVGLRGATTFTQIINAINAATDNSNNKYVIATGADATDGGSFSTSASVTYISTTAFWPIEKQSSGAGGGLEGGSDAGGGANTDIGAVEVHMTGARSGGTGATASASRFIGNLAFVVTFHEAGTEGNGWVLTLTGNSGGGTTVDADAKTVAVNINGNLTYLAMKTAIDAIRVGGVQFFTASYNSGLDSQNAGNGSWTLSGGTAATTNPLAATYDESTNTLAIRALPTDTFDEVMDEIATLAPFQRSRGGSAVDGSMPGDIWLTNGGTTLDTINTPSDTSSTLQYIFAGGIDAAARSAISVVDAQATAGRRASGNWFNSAATGLAFRYESTGIAGNGFRIETWVRYVEELSGGRAHTDVVLGGQTIRFQWRDASADGNGFLVEVRRNTSVSSISPVYRDHSGGNGRLRIDLPDGTHTVNEVINRVNRSLQLDGPDLRLGIVTAILETDNGNAEFTVNSSFTDISQTFQDAGSSLEVVAEYQDASTIRIYAVVNERRQYGGADNAFRRNLMVDAVNAARFEGRQYVVASTDNAMLTSGFTIPSDAVDGYEARFSSVGQSTLLAGGVDQANRITITGVLQTDLISAIIAAYSGTRYTLSAVDGTVGNAIGAFSAEADQNLTGGQDPIGRLKPTVTLADNGTITISAILYTNEAENTTIIELQDAFLAATYLDDNGNRPPFPVSNFTFAETGGAIGDPIRRQNRPTIPTGGEDEIPETPIELISRPNDEVQGPNAEIRYHDTDPNQDILAALVAQGVGDQVVVVYGTDLSALPEAPPFIRSMFRGGGESSGPGDGTGGISGISIQDEGTALSGATTTLDFTGQGVTATGSGAKKTIDIPGGLRPFYQYSNDESTWVDNWRQGDAYTRIAIGETKPADNSPDWTDAIRIEGDSGPPGPANSIWLQYSDDDSSWHDALVPASDIYIRFAVGNTKPGDSDSAWSAGVRFKGQPGEDGNDGADSTVPGVQGEPGPPGSLGLTKVGATLSINGTSVAGPAATALNDQFMLRLRYDRTTPNLVMWSHFRKAELSPTALPLQVQGAGGAHLQVSLPNTGDITFSNAGLLGVANCQVQIFNIGAANGIPAWDADETIAEGDQRVFNHKLYIANKAITGTGNDDPETATDDWDVAGSGGGGGGDVSPPAQNTGYVFYSRPTLAPTNVSASQDLANGATWSQVILNAVSIPGRIYTEWDFITDWAGSLTMTPGRNGTLSVTIKTTHVFNSKTLVVSTEKIWPVRRDQQSSIPLDLFDAFARVALGTFTDSDGTDVTIEAADLEGPTTISLEVIVGYDTEIGNAGATTIQDIEWADPAVRFFQLPHGAGSFTPPVAPSVSNFGLTTGNKSPAAGTDIAGTYHYEFSIAQSSHVNAARIVGFVGTAANPASPTVLATIDAADYHGGVGTITIPSVTLANANDVYSVRLEVYGAGQTVGTDRPISYHDDRITAHAPATANYHWFRKQRVAGQSAQAYAASLNFSNDDLETGSVLDTVDGYDATPGAAGDWIFGLAAVATAPQPSGWTSSGFPASAVFQAAVDVSYNTVNHKVYVMVDDYYRASTDGSVTYVPTIG